MSDAETVVDNPAEAGVEEAAPETAAPIDAEMAAVDEAYQALMNSGQGGRIPCLDASIYPTHVTILVDGVKKDISILDFRRYLEESMGENKTTELKPMALPYGCFSLARSDTTLQLSCYYPGGKKIVKHSYDGRIKDYNVAFPNLIITHQLRRKDEFWIIDFTRYFAVNKTVNQLPDNKFLSTPSAKDGVFVLPMPNVYENNGLCYGGNSVITKYTDNLRGLDYFYQLIFISPFNNDLPIRGLSERFRCEDWLAHLATLDEFPYTMLRGA